MALVSKMYQDIANDPQMKNELKLRNKAKKLLNRARVRMQTIENRNAQTSGYIRAKESMREAGLLTAGGNVSTRLPKTREKLLMTLLKVTSFLENEETTIKGQKKAVERRKKGQIKGAQHKFKERAKIGEYWRLARDYGLFSIIDYKNFAENVQIIRDMYTLEEFEELIIKQCMNPESNKFWNSVKRKAKNRKIKLSEADGTEETAEEAEETEEETEEE